MTKEACETCHPETCTSTTCETKKAEKLPSKDINHIKHVIGIMSGKGGVGKSSVTALLAVALARESYQVGILDADITGPSIPKMFNIHRPLQGSDLGIFPAESPLGIKIISLNLLLPQEDDPVIWRGPLIASAVKQFWTDVLWGELDYLLVDLPPGTGDAPLTVMQSFPLAGIVIVTSPQELANMIVRKAIKMASLMKVKILGLVENMSYILCPDCGKEIYIFGPSRAEEAAAKAGIPLLGVLPLDPELTTLCDHGKIESYQGMLLERVQGFISRISL
ncbi:Chromosome partitioning ATPase, Mrp family, contains Fe-S cluster [Thermanaeromonas toyohensis ToBE]|uniref:Iron-sulfur cluster carrier protein n=1 Tax=Thermanaeromonas toyohensis ToBE TaxID=698762 RepID=A0A1W1W2G1_9FIRM|nr:Mrp/NBP35 family ATP-binding protein [Thermanaeromonas toyohensis]SMB99660.1 Chromosome partitioning ATPase, Mrp family, contains Fe-S cluster [Thermanaeromonas toyohensis ToBE]